ncbi:MAG: carboxylesterase family protein [Bacteroidales bacterium]|nr:carboxylesterase family protein [Bacteroidales bacterium]
MKRIMMLSLLLLLAFPVLAQKTYLYATRDTLNLYLDVYQPDSSAVTTFEGHRKPSVLFVFGGGFIGGERDNAFQKAWFERLTQAGYGVVAIDYRLGMKGYQMEKGLSGLFKASDQFLLSQEMGVEDVCSAVNYLARNDLGVDVNNLVLAGSSAGAIISVATEYHIVNGDAPELPDGFNFKGVMSFAGAVISVSGKPEFRAQPCPIVFFHGTEDQAVAYEKFAYFGRGLWGSSYLDKQFDKKGYPHLIYRFQGRTHDVAAYMNALWEEEMNFLEQDVMLGKGRTIDALVTDSTLPSWGNVSMDSIYRK